MDIAVLGATGTIGSLVADRLEAAGNDVRRLSRASGVNTETGEGLEAALDGADVVVDATNIATIRATPAVRFFARSANNIAAAAKKGGAGRVVCISIAGVTKPGAALGFGYYRGKCAQERAYRAAPIPTTIIRSAQWFELGEQMVAQASLGPVAVLPQMRMAPLATERAADHIVGEIIATGRGVVPEIVPGQNARLAPEDGEDPRNRIVRLRGPEEMTSAQLVRRILGARGSVAGRSPSLVTEYPYLGRRLAGGVLVPSSEGTIVDDLTLDQWLAA
ncbi:NAD(P)H-binding protein [Brachybacterium sp. MASK1Z-5]|uniref:NAD(P)H-binding protein n=1 Tax=Brachybacterium halotolerans TaxID=2795215 RepID=A0ABS1BDW8_9MICO|nr:NAD(P)H-binding protein [Brachybacterium halotolerans]MBK0332835.1 NAD(P)H-binding protein [Brachybacterium halotolerans]